jgi:hypothetical protein
MTKRKRENAHHTAGQTLPLALSDKLYEEINYSDHLLWENDDDFELWIIRLPKNVIFNRIRSRLMNSQ